MLIIYYLGLQAEKNYVMVWNKDVQQVAYLLKQHPKVVFSDERIVLITDSIGVEYYPLSNLHKITFEDSIPIDMGISIQNDGKIQVANEEIVLIGFPADTQVSLNTLDDRYTKNYKTDHTGNLHLSLSGLPTGIFIVKAQKTTIKIIKK